ncbi:MAG: hypothetical protein BWY94_02093 [Actinobacteria bacterium ADurb.BinA094]|nr:MAG: hypothetical protein BWY94_02093 [Actinobacteria bacterium ADurb.BinA094]
MRGVPPPWSGTVRASSAAAELMAGSLHGPPGVRRVAHPVARWHVARGTRSTGAGPAARVRLVESGARSEPAESESRAESPQRACRGRLRRSVPWRAAPVRRRLGARRLPGAGRTHPRVLEGPWDLPQESRGSRGRSTVRLLRGTADRQRPAGLAPRRLAHLQGPLPALQDHAWLQGPAQGRLGHARSAGGAGGGASARDRRQAADRGLRHRRVQPAVQGERHRVPRGVGALHRAHRLLGRHGRRLLHVHQRLHRVGVVDPAADLGQGSAVPGPQGRAVLPTLRYGDQQP